MTFSSQNYECVVHDGVHCTMTVQQLSSRVVVIRIEGTDIGEFGDTPLRAMDRFVAGAGDEPLSLFIDARAVRGASIQASSAWAVWLSMHGATLRGVHMLTHSSFVTLTARFVRRFAQLEDKMTILSQDDAFDLALAQSLRGVAA